MGRDDIPDTELVARLRRLEAGDGAVAPRFDYDDMLERHELGKARARRRLALARGSAVTLVLALLFASLWRLEAEVGHPPVAAKAPPAQAPRAEPRIVRAETYFAVAALEDHIASVDDALNVARLRGGPTDIARLERTRAELIASYTQVRYAEMLSANF